MSDIVLVETVLPHYKIDWSRVDDNSIIVDAGLTNGDVLSVLRKRTSCLVCGIEPNPDCLNTPDGLNFKISRKALTGNSSPDKVTFYQSGGNAGHLSKEMVHYSVNKEVEVETLKIKDLFTEFGIDHIDWLKLNVVGAEWGIMKDMPQEMADKIYQINVQNYFTQLDDNLLPERMNNRLKELGFKTNFTGETNGNIIYGTR